MITKFATREEARKVLANDSLVVNFTQNGEDIVIDATYNAVLKDGDGVVAVQGLKITGTQKLQQTVEDSIRMWTYKKKADILAGIATIDLNAAVEGSGRTQDPVLTAVRDAIRAKAAAKGQDAGHVTTGWVRQVLADESHPAYKTVTSIHKKVLAVDDSFTI